jgi:hypothetical protein
VLPPGDGLPVRLRQGREDSLGLIEWRRARLLGLATPALARQGSRAACTSAGRRTPKVLLIPTT